MIELDGIEYEVKTPLENTEEALGFINDYCSSNNIKNSKGELIQISANWANPLYVILYGLSYLVTVLQKLIYNAGCALNLARASDRQTLNIAEIANVRRKKATKTTVEVIIYASLSNEANASPCHITKDLIVTIKYGNDNITFHPAYETIIPVNTAVPMVLVCDQEGSYSLAENAVSSFDENPQGFRRMTSQPSIPGQKEETIADLKQRIQQRATTSTQLDRAAADITQLEGVTLCNVFFNYSNVSETIINGITVPPRQALLFVQGYSDDIAKVFYNHLSCLTAGKDYALALMQEYTTHAGQKLPVYIIPPTIIYIQVRVFLNEKVIASVRQQLKDAIVGLAEEINIGALITSTKIINKIQGVLPQVSLGGVQLALDDNVFTYQIQAEPYQLIQFDDSKILVVEPKDD